MNTIFKNTNNSDLFEGMEAGDLKRLLSNIVGIDKYVSKLGDDEDVIVLSFEVGGKEPATDLMNFVERGYDWVLDADVSSGELDNGSYITFIEMERDKNAPKNILELAEDICRLSEQKIDEWEFNYHKDSRHFPLDIQNLKKVIPLNAKDYNIKHPDPDDEEFNKDLEAMMETARVPIKKKNHSRDDDMDRLRSRAGLL